VYVFIVLSNILLQRSPTAREDQHGGMTAMLA